jgi:hypothetical protein
MVQSLRRKRFTALSWLGHGPSTPNLVEQNVGDDVGAFHESLGEGATSQEHCQVTRTTS